MSFPIDSYFCLQIEQDFETLFPGAKRRFRTYWPVFLEKIKTEAGKHGIVNLGNHSCNKKLLRQLIIIYIIHILVKSIFFTESSAEILNVFFGTIVISAIKNSKRKGMEDEQSSYAWRLCFAYMDYFVKSIIRHECALSRQPKVTRLIECLQVVPDSSLSFFFIVFTYITNSSYYYKTPNCTECTENFPSVTSLCFIFICNMEKGSLTTIVVMKLGVTRRFPIEVRFKNN